MLRKEECSFQVNLRVHGVSQDDICKDKERMTEMHNLVDRLQDEYCKGNVSCTSYSRTFYDAQMATANCVHPHAQLEHA